MMNSFWWGTKLDGTRRINWTCWNTVPGKKRGGPRFQKSPRLQPSNVGETRVEVSLKIRFANCKSAQSQILQIL